MGFLIISICFTSFIFLLFKWIAHYRLAIFPLVVLNYFFGAAVGILILVFAPVKSIGALPSEIFFFALFIAAFFLANFYFMGKSTQVFGVSPATTAARMSLVIPAVFSIVAYEEKAGWVKILGIIAALAAIFLTLFRKENSGASGSTDFKPAVYLFPLMTFLGTGLLDIFFKLSQVNILETFPNVIFVTLIFLLCGGLGTMLILIRKNRYTGQFGPEMRKWSMILGVANFFAIYTFLLALTESEMPGSVLFPVNSVGIVVLSTFVSFFFFREKLNLWNKTGFVLSVAAILIIYLS